MKLGVYNLIKKIAEGGIAEIYLAKGKTLQGRDKYLVCKCIKPALTSDNDFLESILREAQLSVKMRHPNIMEVFDLCSSEERAYLTMEYMDAPDFRHVLMAARETHSKLSFGSAIYVVGLAAQGLHYAHELCDSDGEPLNLVHRDISPENILLSWNGDVKISDFGIAKTSKMPDITPPDTVKGKFGYMSPEQAWADRVDRRSDVFSLAIVLYEATLGIAFYGGGSIADILMAARVGQFAKPSEIDPDYPSDLENILIKALDIDKNERYQTALEFKQALDECAQQNNWIVQKEAWLPEMRKIIGSQPDPIPRMSAAEIPDDPNTIIAHQADQDCIIETDNDSTIQLKHKALIEELRNLSMHATSSIPAIPTDLLTAAIEEQRAEQKREMAEIEKSDELRQTLRSEDLRKTAQGTSMEDIVPNKKTRRVELPEEMIPDSLRDSIETRQTLQGNQRDILQNSIETRQTQPGKSNSNPAKPAPAQSEEDELDQRSTQPDIKTDVALPQKHTSKTRLYIIVLFILMLILLGVAITLFFAL